MPDDTQKAPKKERVRGSNITLLEKTSADEGNAGSFVVVAGEDKNLRSEADVKKWMTEQGSEGTLYPVRFGKPITRSVKKVSDFS